ncbi:cell division control protein [Pelomyxa schiedti]|nr:cell division control protein [Pelomyxa schiedti]
MAPLSLSTASPSSTDTASAASNGSGSTTSGGTGANATTSASGGSSNGRAAVTAATTSPSTGNGSSASATAATKVTATPASGGDSVSNKGAESEGSNSAVPEELLFVQPKNPHWWVAPTQQQELRNKRRAVLLSQSQGGFGSGGARASASSIGSDGEPTAIVFGSSRGSFTALRSSLYQQESSGKDASDSSALGGVASSLSEPNLSRLHLSQETSSESSSTSEIPSNTSSPALAPSPGLKPSTPTLTANPLSDSLSGSFSAIDSLEGSDADGSKDVDKGDSTDLSQKIVIEHGLVKLGTPEALVARLTTEKHKQDGQFMLHYLLTYSAHTTPLRFLELLIEQYNTPSPPELSSQEEVDLWSKTVLFPLRLRVFIVLKQWVERLWNSFTDNTIIEGVKDFTSSVLSSELKNPAEQLIKLISRTVSGEEKSRQCVFDKQPPECLLPICLCLGHPWESSMLSFSALQPKEIARQITIIEQNLFRAIKPWELIGLAWTKKDRSLSPNVSAMIQHFNQISHWVVEEICSTDDFQDRVKIIERFIDLANCLSELQNYNGLMSVLSGFTNSSAFRLKKTWAAVGAPHTRALEAMRELTDNTKNFQTLRQKLQKIPPPCIPYLGIYLTDLTFIEEGNATFIEEKVNFFKCRLQADVILRVQQFQQTPYCLVPSTPLATWIGTLGVSYSEDTCYKQSLKIEPRETEESAAPPPPPRETSTLDSLLSISGMVSSDDVSILVLHPGNSVPAPMTFPADTTVGEAKKKMLEKWTVRRKAVPHTHSTSPSSVPVVTQDSPSVSLVAPAIKSTPGFIVSEHQSLRDVLKHHPTFTKKGGAFFALIPAPNFINAAYVCADNCLQTFAILDCEAPLSIMTSIFEATFDTPSPEFVFLHYNNSLVKWVNGNLSFTEGVGTGTLIILALERLMKPNYAKHLRMIPGAICGTTAKVSKKKVHCGNGVFRPAHFTLVVADTTTTSTPATTSLSIPSLPAAATPVPLVIPVSSIGGFVGASAFSTSQTALSTSTTIITASSPTISPSATPHTATPHTITTTTLQARKKALSSKDKLKPHWFAIVDGILFCYFDGKQPYPKRVLILANYEVILTRDPTHLLCVVLRPWVKYLKDDRPLVLSWGSDEQTRKFFKILFSQSQVNVETKQFGLPLAVIASRPQNSASLVPPFLLTVFSYLFEHALSSEKLFTTECSPSLLDKVKTQFDAGLEVDMSTVDVCCLGELVRLFFSEMPEPLLTFGLFSKFCKIGELSVAKESSTDEEIRALKQLVDQLPPCNSAVLTITTTFLRCWAESCHFDLMRPAIIFGPLFLRQGGDIDAYLPDTVAVIDNAILMLLRHHSEVCRHDADLMQGFEKETILPPSSQITLLTQEEQAEISSLMTQATANGGYAHRRKQSVTSSAKTPSSKEETPRKSSSIIRSLSPKSILEPSSPKVPSSKTPNPPTTPNPSSNPTPHPPSTSTSTAPNAGPAATPPVNRPPTPTTNSTTTPTASSTTTTSPASTTPTSQSPTQQPTAPPGSPPVSPTQHPTSPPTLPHSSTPHPDPALRPASPSIAHRVPLKPTPPPPPARPIPQRPSPNSNNNTINTSNSNSHL